MSPSYVIIANPDCPRWVPETGWRKWATKLRLRAPRSMIFAGPQNTLYCHPESVPALRKYLDRAGMKYVLGSKPAYKPQPLKLRAVKNPVAPGGNDYH